MAEVAQLKQAQIFDNVDVEMLEQVAAHCERREFAAGQVLFRSGEAADKLFILQSGQVALTVPVSVLMVERELQIDSKGEGELVGWSALVQPHTYTLTATATEAGELVVVGREALLEHCRAHPAMGFAIMSNVARIIGERLGEVKALLIKEVERSFRLA